MNNHVISAEVLRNSKVWITSDVHAKHKNIAKYCLRPGFDRTGNGNHDYNYHNYLILKNHNRIVDDNDTVINLGDLSFRADGVHKFASQFKGRHFFLPGNHDSKETLEAVREIGWTIIRPFSIEVEGGKIAFTHYPIPGEKLPKHTVNVHGHVHNNPYNATRFHQNVSVEATGYMPMPLDTLIKRAQFQLSMTTPPRERDHDLDGDLDAIANNVIKFS